MEQRDKVEHIHYRRNQPLQVDTLDYLETQDRLSYYSKRGYRYVNMEAGHAAQNLSLQAVSLDLGSVVIGAFHDMEVKSIILNLAEQEEPSYIIPVGRR